MDSIIGNDIEPGQRQLVRQLLKLASDPDSQVLMVKQKHFLSALVNYMDSNDMEVKLMAARAIEFLSSNAQNRQECAEFAGLVEKMKVLADDKNEISRGIARRALYNIKGYLNDEDKEFVTARPVNHIEAVAPNKMVQKTGNYSVETLSEPSLCDALQSEIVKITGVISITLEKTKKRIVVVYREKEGNESKDIVNENIKKAIAKCYKDYDSAVKIGYFKTPSDKEDEKENAKEAVAVYGFTSLESRLEKKKKENEEKKKKEKKVSWLFGKVSDVMSSWW